MTTHRYAACILLVALAVPPHAIATAQQAAPQQTASPPQQTAPPPPPGSAADPKLPVDMAKIREALQKNPQLRLETDELKFYVSIIGRMPTFEELVGDFDLQHGQVPGAGMTHEEFLAMVTPQALYSTTGITALDTLQVALTSYGMISLVKRAYQEYKQARTERERRAIQERIERELRELEKRRAAARDKRLR